MASPLTETSYRACYTHRFRAAPCKTNPARTAHYRQPIVGIQGSFSAHTPQLWASTRRRRIQTISRKNTGSGCATAAFRAPRQLSDIMGLFFPATNGSGRRQQRGGQAERSQAIVRGFRQWLLPKTGAGRSTPCGACHRRAEPYGLAPHKSLPHPIGHFYPEIPLRTPKIDFDFVGESLTASKLP